MIFDIEMEKAKHEQCLISIADSKHSSGNKEIVAIAIEDFLLKNFKILSDGYRDTFSTKMCEYLSTEFSEYRWYKNSSQMPFDVYSIDAKVAIENKSSNVNQLKKRKGFGFNDKLVVNATVYPSEAKVKDIVACAKWKNLSEETLESFMDVLVVIVDRASIDGEVIRYRIVDGDYWGISYDVFKGCREMFNSMNEPTMKKHLLETILSHSKDNAFIKGLLSGALPSISFDFRKLISVKNPIGDNNV